MTFRINNALQGKTIAITGASGYIASALIENLLNCSVNIIRVSRQSLSPLSGILDLKADIKTPECWRDIVSQSDIVICLAGNTSVYTARENPVESLESTVLPINQLLKAAIELRKTPRVIYASTATVYGLTEQFPVTEKHPCNPITVYDLHKHFAEQQLALASQNGLVEGIALRLANVYGPSLANSSANDRGILNKVIKSALQGNDLTLYGNGEYIRDYVYIDDVVSAFIEAAQMEISNNYAFNISSGHGVSIKEAFELVMRKTQAITGKAINLNPTSWPKNADPIEFRNYIGCNQLFKNTTNWSPETSLPSGIDRLINFFQEINLNE